MALSKFIFSTYAQNAFPFIFFSNGSIIWYQLVRSRWLIVNYRQIADASIQPATEQCLLVQERQAELPIFGEVLIGAFHTLNVSTNVIAVSQLRRSFHVTFTYRDLEEENKYTRQITWQGPDKTILVFKIKNSS